jgi:uncharacterized protein YprB with RNaseH-like and TPR domain
MVAPDRQRLRAALVRRSAAGGSNTGTGPDGGAAGAARPEGEALRELLQRRLGSAEFAAGRLGSGRGAPVVELPSGEVASNEQGTCWRRRIDYPLSHRHGDVELGAAARLDGARLAELARSSDFAALAPHECLFLDTETTGLSGGAGTVVFAIGLAWLQADALCFEQYFLRDFGEEPAMLAALAARLHEHPVPVTFVGKSFDRHRLAARLAVHRLAAPILTDRHLDLYHLSRRAWGRQLPDCRLRTVEQQCLGLWRDGDLPGSEAPAAFLQWLRDRTGPVDRVLEHNRLDVLSVATLLGQLAGH